MNLLDAINAPFVNDEVYETLKLHGYVIDRNSSYELVSSPRVILLSLDNDYNSTIRQLGYRLSYNTVYFDEYEKRELKNILLENNFVFDNSTWTLIFSDPTFFIASLMNDYEQTLFYMRNCTLQTILTRHEIEQIKEIFMDHDFVYTENSSKFLKSLSCAFLASLEKDGWETLIHYQYNKRMNDDQKDKVFEALKKNISGYNFFPYEVLTDKYILEKIILDDDELDFICTVLMDERRSYSYEDEQLLLKYLNSKNSTIEEELVNMYEKGYDRYTMSLMQMLSISFYIKKRLKEFDISGLKVNLFKYFQRHDGRVLSGLYRPNEILLGISNYTGSIYSMIATLHHEMFHAIQIRDMSRCYIFNDEDIDIYYKDRILREFLGDEYYTLNYKYLKEEYDAEFKAMIETVKLFGKKDVLFFELAEYVREELTNKEVFLASKEKVMFENTSYRTWNRKRYHIDNLFDNIIKYINKNINNIDLDEFNYTYPFLKYEYIFKDNRFVKRSVKNLVKLLDMSEDETKRKIYAAIIKNKINVNKCLNALENRYQVELMIFDDLKESTKEYLIKILNEKTRKDQKYIKVSKKRR